MEVCSARLGDLQQQQQEGASRTEHWTLLGNLKTTVEGLVSTNNPNVWVKYGGLERLCRDMNNILHHGLSLNKAYNAERDYWQFVRDIRWVSPHASHHVEKFLNLHETSLRNGNGVTTRNTAELWLQHSLQSHCLSAQLKPLLGNRSYARKFYTDSAFLLSDAHVTAMFQCLEAVEQNNPRLLAQIDTLVFARKSQSLLPVTKSQSLTALPGSIYNTSIEYSQQRLSGSYSSLYPTPSILGADLKMVTPECRVNGNGQFQGNALYKVCIPLAEDRLPPDGSASAPPFVPCSSKDPLSPVSEMSVSTMTSHSDDPWAGSQEDAQSEVDDGPEYLAIGNLSRRRRTSSQCSNSSSGKSSVSNLFSDSSSQKPDSVGLGSSGGKSSSLLSLLRRSSFSEGQSSGNQIGVKKSHTRSHSDTSVASGRFQGGCRNINVILEDPIAECNGDFPKKNIGMSCNAESSQVNAAHSYYNQRDGSHYLSSGEGLFRRPSEGQSLISYLSEQDFGSCADLEKENAHFSISESLIAAIELMKCNMMSRQQQEEDEDSDKEIQELKQKIRMRRQQIRTKRVLPDRGDMASDGCVATDSGSQFSSRDSMRVSDSGSADDVEEYEIKDGNDGSNLIQMSKSGLSVSMASLFSEADVKRGVTSSSRTISTMESICHTFLHSNSAEAVAMGLLRQFEGMQLPAASELDWLVPEHDAPQKLLPIPDSLPISPDDGEHADIYKLRIRVRGNLEWAPPRPQIIFNIHKAPTRKVAVAKQNYRCAGCGIRTEPDYIRRLRYCEYLGKYFCQCCHENAQMSIPSRILRKWDFGKYYVSNFSKDLLTKIWNDPLFNVQDINSALYVKVKALAEVRTLRVQLMHLKNMFKTCRLSKELLDSFDTLPGHLTEDLHLYSLNDLSIIKRGELVPHFKEMLRTGSLHVQKCMLCQAKGFICEFCQNDDVIFPFELNKCRRCEECKACYHKHCFKSKACPRCERLQARREMLAKSLETYTSEPEDNDETSDEVTEAQAEIH
ncbi:run domain Beclin-1-interacting and cysteine-rich domain-containing protein isoform X3 [Ambystoma mexicanum]|uniref:run domain Beclin-1-interacting and cysteine-rich domain-containing protein isoform X3 n=1 Tax=Ambystoma mexicanum TaxID=8296 RepID=UPI0037E8A81A